MRTGTDEAERPKYAHVERERRWLVDAARWPVHNAVGHVLIEDLYIDGTVLRLRRMTDSASGNITRKLTKKYPTSDVRARPIVTAYLTDAEYAVFATLPARPLRKRRHVLPESAGGYSVDVFLGPLAGLVLAERECADDRTLAALAAPPWALREVTDDPAYAGGMLATTGRPEID